MRATLFFLIIIYSQLLYGQSVISGKVYDISNSNPIGYATVYINGTTMGTITNLNGSFQIDPKVFPCQLVVSCIGYNTKVINIENTDVSNLNIYIKPKTTSIDEVVVKGNDLRMQNLMKFKYYFLGVDKWGENAKIINEDDIIFKSDFKTDTFTDPRDLRYYSRSKLPQKWSFDSSSVEVQRPINLKAFSKKPLMIGMPLLGYNLHIDLIEFELQGEKSTYLCYQQFQPMQNLSVFERRKIEKNRREAYYNSSQHFLKSLYRKELKQNGYFVLKKDKISKLTSEVYLDSLILQINNNNHKAIIGLKDITLWILYYNDSKGLPLDISKQRGRSIPMQSQIYFLSDTCIVRSDGTIPDLSIMFTPSIGAKQTGAMLPTDYEPFDTN